MLRRTLLLSSTALVATGCQHNSPNPAFNVAAIMSDITLITRGLNQVLAQLGQFNIPGLTPALVADVGVAINGITAIAQQIATVTSNAEAQPLVQKIGTYLTAVLNVLTTLPLPAPILMGLRAVAMLLPFIEAAVGLVTSRFGASPASMRLTAGSSMTISQARAYLAQAPSP